MALFCFFSSLYICCFRDRRASDVGTRACPRSHAAMVLLRMTGSDSLPQLPSLGSASSQGLPHLQVRSPPVGMHPTVYPGSQPGTQVVWRKPRRKEADISSLHDVVRLHGGKQKRVAAIMARQQPGSHVDAPMDASIHLAKHVAALERVPLPAGSEANHAAQTMTAHKHRGSKPSSRAEVVQLRGSLKKNLAVASSLSEQIHAWDKAFAELVRQVRVHCAERGELLDEVRCRYGDW
jgi:hypothetical protein